MEENKEERGEYRVRTNDRLQKFRRLLRTTESNTEGYIKLYVL